MPLIFLYIPVHVKLTDSLSFSSNDVNEAYNQKWTSETLTLDIQCVSART